MNALTPAQVEDGTHAQVELKPGFETIKPARPSSTAEANALHLAISAEHLYWSIVDSPGLPVDARGRLRVPSRALAELMQPDLPIEASDAHAVGVLLSGGKIMLCAAEKRVLAALPSTLQTAGPQSIPRWIDSRPPSTAIQALNLLTEDFEPLAIREQRSRTKSTIAFAACALLMCFCLGLWRREREFTSFSRDAQARAASLLTAADPGAASPASALLHIRARIDRLQAAITASSLGQSRSADAAVTLADLLTSWPTSDGVTTELVSLTPTAGTVVMFTEGDPKPFLGGLHAPPGWKIDEPRIVASRGGTQVTLQLRPEGAVR